MTQRNLFCSACPARPRPAPDPPAQAGPRLEDAVLVATQVADGDARWTLAEVRFPGAGQLRVLGQGSRVADARITEVTATQVAFLRGGRRGVLDLLRAADGKPPDRASPPRVQGCPPGVHRLGPGRFGLSRSVLLALVQGLGGATRDVAVAPMQRQGRLAGLRVHRVRPRSLFHCLGLRAGDEVTAVNNRALSSPDVILTLLAQLPGARQVTVSVTRSGRPLSLDYSIE